MSKDDMTDAHRAKYAHLPEFREGYQAAHTQPTRKDNPYPWNNHDWWRNEAWQAGQQQAQIDDDDDDD